MFWKRYFCDKKHEKIYSSISWQSILHHLVWQTDRQTDLDLDLIYFHWSAQLLTCRHIRSDFLQDRKTDVQAKLSNDRILALASGHGVTWWIRPTMVHDNIELFLLVVLIILCRRSFFMDSTQLISKYYQAKICKSKQVNLYILTDRQTDRHVVTQFSYKKGEYTTTL